MIITPHMLAGAALGYHAPGLISAFGLGLASHFVLDNIAHWDYLSYVSLKNKEHLIKIAIDVVVAVIITFLLVWPLSQKLFIVAGIIGALLPDVLEVIYMNFKIKTLKSFSKIHLKLHSKEKLRLFEGWFPMAVIIIVAALALVFKL